MAVPDFQTLMLPVLRFLADGQSYASNEMEESMAEHFKLTLAERRELLPSGRQARFSNRVGWARTYLKKAELLKSAGRSRSQITKRGQEALQAGVTKIDIAYLMKFPEFVAFRYTTATMGDASSITQHSKVAQTPFEMLETSYNEITEALAQDLVEKVKECSPNFFERLVIDLLLAMGYGGSREDAGQAIGGSGDGGIDGVIKEDRLGLNAIYIQAKNLY